MPWRIQGLKLWDFAWGGEGGGGGNWIELPEFNSFSGRRSLLRSAIELNSLGLEHASMATRPCLQGGSDVVDRLNFNT